MKTTFDFAMKRDEEVVYLGEEKSDFLKVHGADGEDRREDRRDERRHG